VTTTGIRDNIAAADRNPAEIAVREIMSGSLILAKPEWTVKECSQFMKKHNIHHLPVVDEHGTLVGQRISL
jgi:CBS-domain-containing membrane protein